MRLYHYRSIESALKELKNGTFHFSAKEELNDPLEGFVRVFWKGDKAAWEELLRNYVCSLYHALELYLLKGSEETILHHKLIVDLHHYESVAHGALLQELGDRFLSDNEVREMALFFGKSRLTVYENELRLFLNRLQMKAMILCMRILQEHGTIPDVEANEWISMFSSITPPPFPFEKLEEASINGMNHVLFLSADNIICMTNWACYSLH